MARNYVKNLRFNMTIKKYIQYGLQFKICVGYFSLVFYIFSLNDSHSKTVKNIFCFIWKTLFILKIFKFLQFFLFLTTLSWFKWTNGSGIINFTNWLAQICKFKFWNNSKTTLRTYFFETLLEFLGSLLYPWKFQTKQSFTPRNSTKLYYAPQKFKT